MITALILAISCAGIGWALFIIRECRKALADLRRLRQDLALYEAWLVTISHNPSLGAHPPEDPQAPSAPVSPTPGPEVTTHPGASLIGDATAPGCVQTVPS